MFLSSLKTKFTRTIQRKPICSSAGQRYLPGQSWPALESHSHSHSIALGGGLSMGLVSGSGRQLKTGRHQGRAPALLPRTQVKLRSPLFLWAFLPNFLG